MNAVSTNWRVTSKPGPRTDRGAELVVVHQREILTPYQAGRR